MCQGKEAFSSPQLAAKIAKRRANKPKNRRDLKRSQSYRCKVCGLYHIGTAAPSVQAEKRRRFKAAPKRSLTEIQSLDDLIEEGVFA